MSSKNAAAYARSSKDRADVSIEAQLRQLRELATSQGNRLVREFTDAVYSGADENRPGFQALLAEIRGSTRDWATLYLLDTSRLSRRRITAIVFEEHECKHRGIRIIYKSVPDADPITEMLLKSILQAMDEFHSMVSRAKGLAGMAENIHQGWRAGGRAPIGYRLKRMPTGTVRDGEPVTKSVLAPSADAPAVQAYLKGRARGLARSQLVTIMAGLNQIRTSSLVDLEWNALTYAGHTAWNRHADQGRGVKRRPRADWLIKRDTHPALITDAEAETILARLEAGRRPRYQTGSIYLLSGLLEASDGRGWHGKGQGFYGLGSKSIAAHRVEGAVLARVAEDLRSPEFIQSLVRQAQASLRGDPDDDGASARLNKERVAIDRRIDRLTGLLSETEIPAPLLRQVEKLELERQGIEDAIAAAKRRIEQAKAVRLITPEQVRRLLDDMAEHLGALPKPELKAFVASLIARVILDPGESSCCIHYRIPLATGDLMASPRRTAQIPCRRAG